MHVCACATLQVFICVYCSVLLVSRCHFISTEPISYGRTQQRYITKDRDFLSYPQSAIVSVLAKRAYVAENGEEFWEAEVSNFFFKPQLVKTSKQTNKQTGSKDAYIDWYFLVEQVQTNYMYTK